MIFMYDGINLFEFGQPNSCQFSKLKYEVKVILY